MEYHKWNPKKWKTDFSEAEWLFMESLIDNKLNLKILLSDANKNLYEVKFENFPAYRNILEEYRLNLWALRDQKWPELGNSWIIENSDWLEMLTSTEPLLTHHEEDLKHYLICTQNDVIEIVSSDMNPVVVVMKKHN